MNAVLNPQHESPASGLCRCGEPVPVWMERCPCFEKAMEDTRRQETADWNLIARLANEAMEQARANRHGRLVMEMSCAQL